MRATTAGQGCDPARLEAFLRESGLSYTTRSKSYVFDCPLCGSEDMLWMHRHNGRFRCWKCAETAQFKGAPEYAFKELTGRPIITIKAELYGAESVPASLYLDIRMGDLVDDDGDLDFELPEEAVDLPDRLYPNGFFPLDHPHGARGAAYLAGRGVPLSLAVQYDVRYCAAKRSVVFPAWVGERLVGWQYRIVYPERSFTTETHLDGAPIEVPVDHLKIWTDDNDGELETWRDRCVMFANRVTSDHAVLCEGPVDALKAHLVGGNVASMGKAVSLGQVRYLLNAGIRKLYLALDPDAAGELNDLLAKFEGVAVHQVIVPRGFKDLGAMPLEAARDTILGAPPLPRGRLHVYLKGIGLVSGPEVV